MAARSYSKASKIQYRHTTQWVDTAKNYLLLEIFNIERKIVGVLKESDIRTEDADVLFKKRIAEDCKTIFEVSRNIDYADDHAVARMFVSYIDGYVRAMCTYASALQDPKAHERHVPEDVSKGFEKTIWHIDSMSMEHLYKTIVMLRQNVPDMEGEPNITYFGDWSRARKKDRFGLDATRDSLREVLAAAKCPSEDEALWAEKLTALAGTMGGIMRTGIARYHMCLSARAKASAGLYDGAIYDLGSLVKNYTIEEAERLLRGTPPENAG